MAGVACAIVFYECVFDVEIFRILSHGSKNKVMKSLSIDAQVCINVTYQN